MSNRKCLTFDSNVSHILEDHFYPAFNSTRKCLSIGAGSNVKVSSNFNYPYGRHLQVPFGVQRNKPYDEREARVLC